MVGSRLHDRDAAWCQRAGFRPVEDTPNAHVQRARNDGDVFDARMPMRRHLEVGGKLETEHDWHRLVQLPLDDRDFDARE